MTPHSVSAKCLAQTAQDQAGYFCTFNGLMVTAQVLRLEGAARRVGILDFDMHYGDAGDDILLGVG